MLVENFYVTNEEMAAHHGSFQKYFIGVSQCDTTAHQKAAW